MSERDAEPVDPPPAPSVSLLDFQTADVISLMIYPPRPTLVVSGVKADPAMHVALVPLSYVAQPEYWGIQVVGTVTGASEPAGTPAPYSVEVSLVGITGSAGVEVVGASRTLRLSLTPANTGGA